MQLLFVHQILIASAAGLAALFGLRGAVLFAKGGDRANLMVAFVAAAVTFALYRYFLVVRAKWIAQQTSAKGKR